MTVITREHLDEISAEIQAMKERLDEMEAILNDAEGVDDEHDS